MTPMGQLSAALARAHDLDVRVYRAIARASTPRLDDAMARLSEAANYSRLSLAASALLASVGGERGRCAASRGLASIAVTATVVNAVMKPLSRRRRPEREAHDVPVERHVAMPISRSFPSGHSAAAFAFAAGAGHETPRAAPPLYALAALVAYSRLHTGVHYPSDVVVGSLSGLAFARLTNRFLDARA
jgi:membrane-associated phospholipid phosphatase